MKAALLVGPQKIEIRDLPVPVPREGEVLVYGTGTIGLFYVQLAVLSGARVTAFNASEPRLEVARKLGAIETFRSGAELEAKKGDFTIVYETSGAADALAHIIRSPQRVKDIVKISS